MRTDVNTRDYCSCSVYSKCMFSPLLKSHSHTVICLIRELHKIFIKGNKVLFSLNLVLNTVRPGLIHTLSCAGTVYVEAAGGILRWKEKTIIGNE